MKSLLAAAAVLMTAAGFLTLSAAACRWSARLAWSGLLLIAAGMIIDFVIYKGAI